MSSLKDKIINRRQFMKVLGGTAVATGMAMTSCSNKNNEDSGSAVLGEVPKDKMTYRVNNYGDKVSILGYGMMRLPTLESGEIDQEMVNHQVDYAIEHGMNMFDTAPFYCKARSEKATGEALSRHSRDEYFVSSKMSNYSPSNWSKEASIKLYHSTLEKLKVDYLDYYLLHSVGGTSKNLAGERLSSMDTLQERFFKNGLLNYLVEERKAGRIRNLGFSFHGDVKVFDYLMSIHPNVKWDIVLIQLNYVDWKHAEQIGEGNINAEYLYNELDKRGIPAFVMEPLLGGSLANMNEYAVRLMKEADPESSIASWAFRFAGSHPRILSVLSGMTYMEHLQDNIRTYSPLKPLNDKEYAMLEAIADNYVKHKLVPCTTCQYCMPCPYGIDIPSIFSHYNKCINEGIVNENVNDSEYRKSRRAFLIGYDRSVPKLRQADKCIGCEICTTHCPQRINIPQEMQRIDKFVSSLKKSLY